MRSSMHADPKSIIFISAGFMLPLSGQITQYGIVSLIVDKVSQGRVAYLAHRSIFSGFRSQ